MKPDQLDQADARMARLTLNLQNRARPQRGIRFARDRHGVGAGRCLWARAGGRVAADAWSPRLAAR